MTRAISIVSAERRLRRDRRQRLVWSVIYGSFNPRRRRPARRLDDFGFQALDWHGAHLLAVSIGILILNVADAFMTVKLLAGGAVEVNPVMEVLVTSNTAVFAALKMGMTGVSILLMVVLARYRFMRLIRVEMLLYCVFVGYLTLIGYEIWMLQSLAESNIF